MEDLEIFISSPNNNKLFLNSEQLRDIIKQAKRYKSTEQNKELWNKITSILWNHIDIGYPNMDMQLLSSTCFYTTLSIADKKDEFLLKIKEVLEKEALMCEEYNKHKKTLQAVSLMYGMFQSSFLVQTIFDTTLTGVILEIAFKLLIRFGYEYSQYSFIAFKTMFSFKKVCGTDLQKFIFTSENQIVLLNFVNHNWENPISGVRDFNRVIFQTLLTTFDKDLLQRIVADINSFYWNKAKYLMISEIVENSQDDISTLMKTNGWVDGLISSLYKPGLVSAGADMYYAVLKKMKNESEWHNIFFDKVFAILNGSSSKAIEYFNNYWCLTTLKYFPSLFYQIFDKLMTKYYAEHLYYSILFLMKQGCKLGIFNKNWSVSKDYSDTEKLIMSGLEHYDVHVRILAFEIICLSHEKSMPSQIEYSLIIEYVKNNVNSDCTVLRLNMLNSITFFMSQLHILFRNTKIQNVQQEGHLIDFFKKLQEFIVYSINLDGNYQRKITSIKLLYTMISCLNEVPRKKKQQTRDISETLSDFLIRKQCCIIYESEFVQKLISLLKDPSDDIRENVLKLILNHYFSVFTPSNNSIDFYSNLVEDALLCIRNKFFYEINCGHVMFKLIINLLLKKQQGGTVFRKIDDVFDFGFKELLSEYNLKRDVLTSIEEGKQLHSFICILQLVLEAYMSNSYKIVIPEVTVLELLDILEGVINQFIWEQNSASSDFSKMNEMIENIIEQSGFGGLEDKEDGKISGLHQIVLNCLWLNVKASCDLAALLVIYRTDDIETINRSLSIITHVLESSRHKGAIEAAGTSLGKCIQYLTNLPEDSIGAKLPQTLLESKLDMLITEASKMASITRRGAGLSIMVHRIVSSDMRRGKPLFHYFMKTLLVTCNNIENIPSTADISNIENCADLPKAILIHFLTKIVTDSSLASDMMFYSAELGELAFGNLASSHWQIRNAALQLYGALIPKLIGQKKASGTDEETIATVAYDELITHSPKLWSFITEQLKCESGYDKIRSHSNLIPILNLLASSAKRYSFSYHLKHNTSEDELLRNLFRVLDSPIHTVRRLTAKCIFNIFQFETIYNVLSREQSGSENLLHGSLLLLKLSYQYYSLDGIYLDKLNSLIEKFLVQFQSRKHSYWSREVLDSISFPSNYKFDNLKEILKQTENVNEPGVFLWINTLVKNSLHYSDWENIPALLELFLDSNDYELYCKLLQEKLEKERNIPDDILKSIANILLSFERKYNSCIIWKILYYIISLKIEMENVNVQEILEAFILKGNIIKLRYVIPFIASLFSKLGEGSQRSLLSIIFKLSDFENSDLDTRYIAALANNEIGKVFYRLTDDVKVDSIKSAILLLQDEDEDVRNISVNYYKNIRKLNTAVHPYICLSKILSSVFLVEAFSEPQNIKALCDDVLCLLSNNIHSSNDTYNPFANDAKNIYIEMNSLKQSLLELRNLQ